MEINDNYTFEEDFKWSNTTQNDDYFFSKTASAILIIFQEIIKDTSLNGSTR
jgi:hypothetical protein